MRLLIFVGGLALLMAFVQVGALTLAFDKLGLSPGSAMLLLLTSVIGSTLNLPLFMVDARPPPQEYMSTLRGSIGDTRQPFTGKTMIAVNVGGGLVPTFFSAYLIAFHGLPLWDVVLAVTLLATISHVVSRPVPGIGIGMPVLVAPVSAAMVALLLLPEQSAPLAYIGGTMGVLIGADLLRLRDVRRLGTPIASIGGAGTFDGIFITGIVAVLLT